MKIRQNGCELFVLRRDNGDFIALYATIEECFDTFGDRRILGLVALEFFVGNMSFCWWVFGRDALVDIDVWRLAEAIFALLDDIMRELENGSAAAVVFAKQNMLWMIFFIEFEEVRSVGALEAINCLIVVADCHDVWMAFVGRVVGE